MTVQVDQVVVTPDDIMAGLIEMMNSETQIRERLAEIRASITTLALNDDFVDNGPKEVLEQVALVGHKVSYIETVMDSLVFFTRQMATEFMPDKD